MNKDVGLFLDSASEVDTPHELAERCAALWRDFAAADPAADFSAMHRYLESLAERSGSATVPS